MEFRGSDLKAAQGADLPRGRDEGSDRMASCIGDRAGAASSPAWADFNDAGGVQDKDAWPMSPGLI
jgi:hypothetical protein